MSYRYPAIIVLAVALSGLSFGQEAAPSDTQTPQAKPAPEAQSSQPKPAEAAPRKPNHAAAYYHYSMAHIYEELVSIYGRTEFATKAIDEYRQAIENDPGSEYLNAGLAELYAKTGRIRDAVVEAQDIIKRDPNNLDARKLLGRIYLRSLGDTQAGTQSQNILKLAIEQYEQIVKLEPRSVEDHLLLGRLYRINNDLLKAENEFKTAVSLQPDSEDAVTTLSYLYNDEGDSAHAVQVLNAVPDANRTSKLYMALGYSYEQQKDYKNAVAAYRKSVELDHDNLDAARGLAQNLMNDGQADAAMEQYRSIAEADPQDAQTLMRMAEIYRRTGKFDMALDALKRAQAVVQDSLEVPYNIAVIYEAQGKFDEAAQMLQDLLKKSEKPEDSYTSAERNNRAVFLERLGSIYRTTGKTQLAVDTFRRMMALGEENGSRGYQEIIETYRDAKNWPQATAVAQEAAVKYPQDKNLKLMLASQLADNGQPDKGINEVKTLLKGTPDDRETYIALAQIYSRLRRWNDAEGAVQQAAKLASKPDEKENVDFVQGSIYERQKKYDQAEEVFKRILITDPNNAVVLNYLGYMNADRGIRLEESLSLIKKAIQLDPQNGAYLDSLGWAYYKLGNYDQAEENLRKAVDRIHNDPTVLDHLGDLYQKTGRLKLAAAHWERALDEYGKDVSANVDPSEVAQVQKKLESARVKLAKQAEQK